MIWLVLITALDNKKADVHFQSKEEEDLGLES